ncbi:RELT-like protein 2 [Betta splendens]|uniref:RELT-like protein 2 n=1 Tax=Betta splendens TaxID=158456 RepID=A0A6P7NRF0_BETSP|nr:RELT-like protein 2 [Betta splendens]XP_029020559.1 RELT-like protein 2 [Betta splendens]XP_029020561.1 RELT-like protein 2 [Betta splendens]XP_029020562.1 RELT-like protein 2 [Betta splendens]XP_029020563.1 RELT-like protein 2 [Betta splendens]XP_029020564.1 RELT-like protein 2 [Betta splendens]XP_029020565.1 RELT-like protein 2 [Betta splendens]XP_040928552.1 RELT-like protein 2 [Betta splendens]
MTELEAPAVGEHPPPYMIFLVVFLFFLTGLLGFLICHLLKRKGYHCRTQDLDEEEEEEKTEGNSEDDDEENQDTVEKILKCILENEANMEAFNEMLGSYNICARHDPRLRKDSLSCVPPHHHTVHSDTNHNTCHLCAQIGSKKGRRQSRTPRLKQRPGEQTVFSVGRFRVTHTDKKLYGGSNALVSSGDQLDQSQNSNEKKESGYTLRSMFKDAPPTESTNGVGPHVGKRRKSVSIFGLRRGSEPVGIKGGEDTGSDHRERKSAKRAENNKLFPTCDTNPGSKPEPNGSQNVASVMPQHDAKTTGSGQSKKQAAVSSSTPDAHSKHGPGPETVKPSIGSMVTSSLLLSSPTWSKQTHNTAEKLVCVRDNVLKIEEAFDPLQSSTPIDSMPGLFPVILTDQHDLCSSLPVTQTTPDLSSSLDLELGFGGSLASLAFLPVKAPSSCSLSPPAAPQSPKRTYTASVKAALAPTTLGPKLLSGEMMSSKSPILSTRFGKCLGTLQALPSPPIFSVRPKHETKPVSSQNLSPSPAGQHLASRSLPLSPSSPLFPFSPVGGKIGSVTIYNTSPDSKKVFSVVTMVEDENPLRKEPGQKVNESETAGISPALDQGEDVSAVGVAQPKSQRKETCEAEGRLLSAQDRCDMTKMQEEEKKLEPSPWEQDCVGF